MNDVALQVIDLLVNLDPEDFTECNHHEIARLNLALVFAKSVLQEASEIACKEQAARDGNAARLGTH